MRELETKRGGVASQRAAMPSAQPWGQQMSQGQGPIERIGVRHLDANDPLRRAALVSTGRRKGMPRIITTTCHECRFEKTTATHFTKSQLKKQGHARCNECVAGEPPQTDPDVVTEPCERPPRGVEGRLCWGCSRCATGHEVYCQTCKRKPVWFCTPECRASHVRLHMMWHIRKLADPSFELHIGQKVSEEEISRVIDEWRADVQGGPGQSPD